MDDTQVEEACEDGGVVYSCEESAPKVINSHKITSFACEGSFEKPDKNGYVENYFYSAIIKLDSALFKVYNRFGEGESLTAAADERFMCALYELFLKYDLAKNNGRVYRVSGLPEGYGAYLKVEFDSGESVYSYDNQSCFLSDDLGLELYSLFKGGSDDSSPLS